MAKYREAIRNFERQRDLFLCAYVDIPYLSPFKRHRILKRIRILTRAIMFLNE